MLIERSTSVPPGFGLRSSVFGRHVSDPLLHRVASGPDRSPRHLAHLAHKTLPDPHPRRKCRAGHCTRGRGGTRLCGALDRAQAAARDDRCCHVRQRGFPNGYATVFPSNRITLYLSSPASEIGPGRYDEWLRLVITHELTHIFHLDRADGVWARSRRCSAAVLRFSEPVPALVAGRRAGDVLRVAVHGGWARARRVSQPDSAGSAEGRPLAAARRCQPRPFRLADGPGSLRVRITILGLGVGHPRRLGEFPDS